jgi:hypothetical protein
MSRPIEQILRDMLGDRDIEIARITAHNEKLIEANEALARKSDVAQVFKPNGKEPPAKVAS